MTRIQADSCIFYKKDYCGKLETVMSVHVDDVIMSVMPETLENIKYMIKLKFNIKESVKVKNFLGVYHKWGHNAKGPYAKKYHGEMCQ